MTDTVLNILKFVLLGLLYLFFARVLWAVWSEVRTPKQPATNVAQRQAGPRVAAPREMLLAPDEQQRAQQGQPRQRRPPKGRSGTVARLVILEPKSRRGTTIALGTEITLGRDPNCSITIDDDSFVSQLHFRVYTYEGQPMLEDLGSTNGTFHNGTKITGAKPLHQGDRIQVGTTVIEAQ